MNNPPPWITAGELRAAGIQVGDHVPDCACVPRSAIHFEPAPAHVSKDGRLSVEIRVTFTEPFRWVEFDAHHPVDRDAP